MGETVRGGWLDGCESKGERVSAGSVSGGRVRGEWWEGQWCVTG